MKSVSNVFTSAFAHFPFVVLLCGTISMVLGSTPVFGQASQATLAHGQKIYTSYCSTCHQSNGKGLGAVYPPLAGSDYLKNTKKEQVIKDVVNGKAGKLKVNGKDYNGVMVALPKRYTDADAAAALTYVYNNWSNNKSVVTEAEVKKVRKK